MVVPIGYHQKPMGPLLKDLLTATALYVAVAVPLAVFLRLSKNPQKSKPEWRWGESVGVALCWGIVVIVMVIATALCVLDLAFRTKETRS